MRTFATRQPVKDVTQQEQHGTRGRSLPVSPLSAGTPLLQRKCACGGSCPRCQDALLQPKLTLSEPGDRYEQEADRVAEQVMRIPEPSIQPQIEPEAAERMVQRQEIANQITPLVQRQVLPEEQEDGEETLVDDTSLAEDEEDIEPDETGMPKRENGVAGLTSVDTSNIHIPRGLGHPLTTDTRDFMEQRFGYDFSQVRVHTDPVAEKSAQQLKARAYTVRENIYFNQGQYTPESGEGRKLLAHELTHVIQQSARSSLLEQSVQRQPSDPSQASKGKKKGGGNVCSAGDCPQGKQKKVVRDDCSEGEPADKDRFITELNVSLSAQKVEVVWSDGTTEQWDCSPNSSVTPTGTDVVGVKCSINHTNKKKDGMAWFTGFKSEGLRIGFHDSQRVGKGIHSHGCVRVCCDKAKIINQNTWSGKTTIKVTSK
jgi:hypothetical protein